MDRVLGGVFATVLGLIALGAVVYLMGTATDTSRINQLNQDLGVLASNARAQFQQSQNLYANFNNGNAAALIAGGVVPGDMVKGGALVDAWNDAVAIAPATSTGGITNGAFSITFGGGIPVDSCTKVVTSLTGYVTLVVGNSTYTPTTTPDAVSAATNCAISTSIVATYQ